MSTVGKLYTRVILVCLQKLAECIYLESQCGFQAECSTAGMVFSLRQLQEKCREQQKPHYVAFIDLTKLFTWSAEMDSSRFFWKLVAPPPPKTTQYDKVVSRCHEGNHPVWGQYIWAIGHQEWCQTRLCPCAHPLHASSILCCWSMPSGPWLKVYTYTPDQMDDFLTSPDWEWRPRCMRPSLETCSSLMTL